MPQITINRWYLYHSQSWLVYGTVLPTSVGFPIGKIFEHKPKIIGSANQDSSTFPLQEDDPPVIKRGN